MTDYHYNKAISVHKLKNLNLIPLSHNHKYGFELGSLTFQFLIFVFSTAISFFFLLRSLWNDCLWLAVARSEAVVGLEPCML